jgi:hypothetical protein
VFAEERLTIARRVGEVLPRRPGDAVVLGTFKNEDSRSRRVGHFDENIGNVEHLSEADGEIHFIVLKTAR